ncbi:putative tubulin polyglutamylase ttll-15 isoform X3 [Tachypleus tridentatus]|uniref:putative tubulin polyglutamylase ttll-15 isoform X3 n=1 Tax=Tachypleus tridentatus TaxID=6853 RepID=UPI003FD26D7E
MSGRNWTSSPWPVPRSVSLVIAVLIIGILLTALNVYELHRLQKDQERHNSFHMKEKVNPPEKFHSRVVWVHGKKLETGYLKHVFAVFERLGFQQGDSQSKWDVLWTHDYPFTQLSSHLQNLKPHQKVNHFPGSGYITNKVNLATSMLKHIPPAFQIPADKEKLLQYARQNPQKMWVQKSNSHRGISVQKIGDLDLESEGTFVQEYIHNPLLIDGRFCVKEYYPFDPVDIETYVVGDDYLPIWKVSSLQKYYTQLGYTMKESLNAYIQSLGKQSSKIWSQIKEAVQSVYFEKEKTMIRSAKKFRNTRNFFEMVRFDFVVDGDLNVFIMEANMSPNLSSAHFPENKLLYEQVIFNVLSLVGVGYLFQTDSLKTKSSDETNMVVSDRDIQVFAHDCVLDSCKYSCQGNCQLCTQCLTDEEKYILKDTYQEHLRRGNCRRVIPAATSEEEASQTKLDDLHHQGSSNALLKRWFQGKCLQDPTWCT